MRERVGVLDASLEHPPTSLAVFQAKLEAYLNILNEDRFWLFSLTA